MFRLCSKSNSKDGSYNISNLELVRTHANEFYYSPSFPAREVSFPPKVVAAYVPFRRTDFISVVLISIHSKCLCTLLRPFAHFRFIVHVFTRNATLNTIKKYTF